jgi:hypothetical protein
VLGGGGGFIVPVVVEGSPSSGPAVPKGGVTGMEGEGIPLSSEGDGAGLVGPTGVLGCNTPGGGARGGGGGVWATAMPLAVSAIKPIAKARRVMAGHPC